jgi:uncharacterized protein
MSRIVSLHVYPVKACGGIEVPRADVEARGLAGDRRWMIVDDAGHFLTQREHPELCMVRTAFAGDALTLTYQGRALEVPRASAVGERMRVTVWSSEVEAVEHTAARAFVSGVVGRAARLVYMPDDTRRAVTSARGLPGDIVSFADGYPLLLASTSSLADLEARAGVTLGMERFRPNVVVDHDVPFAEDSWRTLALGNVPFRAPKACDRCVVTTTDQATGERGKEPLRTLATFRKWDGQVWFAVNLAPDGTGPLAKGDPVTVLTALTVLT